MMSPFWSGKGGGLQETDIDVELITTVVTSCGGADGPTQTFCMHKYNATWSWYNFLMNNKMQEIQ